jgi:transcriptional regulator with XRE-family HTH domain
MKKDSVEECLVCANCGRGQFSIRQPLLQCSVCLRAYHLFCLPPGASVASTNWVCRNHSCIICSVVCSPTTPIYHCILCPNAFCHVHLPMLAECVTAPSDTPPGLPFVRYVRCPCRQTTLRSCQQLSSTAKTSITADASSPQTYHSDFPLDSVSLEEDFERDALATQKNTLSPIERNDSCSTPEESDTPTHALQFQLHSKDITKPDTVLLNVVRRIMQETNKLQKEIAAELNVSASTISKWLSGKKKTHGWQKLEAKILRWIFEENLRRSRCGQLKREVAATRNFFASSENKPPLPRFKMQSYPKYNWHIMNLLATAPPTYPLMTTTVSVAEVKPSSIQEGSSRCRLTPDVSSFLPPLPPSLASKISPFSEESKSQSSSLLSQKMLIANATSNDTVSEVSALHTMDKDIPLTSPPLEDLISDYTSQEILT